MIPVPCSLVKKTELRSFPDPRRRSELEVRREAQLWLSDADKVNDKASTALLINARCVMPGLICVATLSVRRSVCPKSKVIVGVSLPL